MACHEPGTRLADRPSIGNVVRHMFKRYDGNANRVYCVSCNRVLEAAIGLLDSHFDTCRRIAYTPRAATAFQCGPCNLTVKDFEHWKRAHVGSEKHWDRCNNGANYRRLYTKTCVPCDTVLYGTVDAIGRHFRATAHKLVDIIDTTIPTMSLLMNRVYRARLIGVTDWALCCAGCCGWLECTCDGRDTALETFYCPTCRGMFVCDQSAYEWHLSSTEHLALHSWTGAPWSPPEHFKACSGRRSRRSIGPLPPDTDYRAFRCDVCSKTSYDVRSWADHVQSASHPVTGRGRHYECAECRVLYFGTWSRADRGCHAVAAHRLRPVAAADPMRYVYRELNAPDVDPGSITFFYRQATGTFGRCDRSAEPKSVPHYCSGCRLEFYGDAAAYRQHVVTVQHLLLQLVAPTSEPSPPVKAAAAAVAVTVPDPHVAAPAAAGPDENMADEAYGRYVAARLKAIQDRTLKTNVKLAIESLFDLSAC